MKILEQDTMVWQKIKHKVVLKECEQRKGQGLWGMAMLLVRLQEIGFRINKECQISKPKAQFVFS